MKRGSKISLLLFMTFDSERLPFIINLLKIELIETANQYQFLYMHISKSKYKLQERHDHYWFRVYDETTRESRGSRLPKANI